MSDAIDGVEKPKRVLELELRIESDKYDTDAWSELLRRAGSVVQVSTSAGPVPQATLDGAYASYDAFLAVFPTSVSTSCSYTVSVAACVPMICCIFGNGAGSPLAELCGHMLGCW